jgi:hypothetical protein
MAEQDIRVDGLGMALHQFEAERAGPGPAVNYEKLTARGSQLNA